MTQHGGGLAEILRERTVEFRTMGRSLRTAIAIAALAVVATAVLVVLRDAPSSDTPVVASEAGLTSVPVVILWATVAVLALAWGYVLAASLHAHPAVGAFGVAAYLAALMPISAAVGWHGGPAWVRGAALAAILALAILSWARRRREPFGATSLALGRSAAMVLLAATVSLTFAWDAHRFGIDRFFTFGIAHHLLVLSFFLLPMLVLTGGEFSEWAELAGGGVGGLARRARSPVVLAALTGAVALAVLAHLVATYQQRLLAQVATAAVATGLVAWRARVAWRSPSWPHHVPEGTLALAAVAVVAVPLAVIALTVRSEGDSRTETDRTIGGRMKPFVHDVDPTFRILAPENWEVRRVLDGGPGSDRTIVAFTGASTGNGAQVYVVSEPRPAGAPAGTALSQVVSRFYGGMHPAVGAATEDDGWRVVSFALDGDLVGVSWEKPVGGRAWLVYGLCRQDILEPNLPLFRVMVKSFVPAAAPVPAEEPAAHAESAPDRGEQAVILFPFAAWLATAILAGALVPRAVRKGAARHVATLLFLFTAATLLALAEIVPAADRLSLASLDPASSLRLPGIQAVAAIGTLVLLAVLAARKRLDAERAPLVSALFVLNLGLQILEWLNGLYTTASEAGARLSVAQAVVILVALVWELTGSGASVANGHGPVLPRAARVLAFCGNLTLVATATLFFSSLRVQASGAAVASPFESEFWPATGILRIGVPALLLSLAFRLRPRKPEAR